MGTKYGTTYEYDGLTLSGWKDENGNIEELSFSIEHPGYWGNTVKVFVYPSEDGNGWFIECGVNNQMADYMSNSWETWHSEGGFATIEDAVDAGYAWSDSFE